MKVILAQDVDNLGLIGAIVAVKDGYARNFLLPKGMATVANEGNKRALDHQLRVLARKRKATQDAAKALATKLEKVSLTIAKQVGEDERIFGTVTSAEVSELLAAEGLDVSRKMITLPEEIRKVGVYTAEVRLHPEVVAKFKVWVVSQ